MLWKAFKPQAASAAHWVLQQQHWKYALHPPFHRRSHMLASTRPAHLWASLFWPKTSSPTRPRGPPLPGVFLHFHSQAWPGVPTDQVTPGCALSKPPVAAMENTVPHRCSRPLVLCPPYNRTPTSGPSPADCRRHWASSFWSKFDIAMVLWPNSQFP